MDSDYINLLLYKNALVELASVIGIQYWRRYYEKWFLHLPQIIVQHLIQSRPQILFPV
jgi:hypothetical protein